MISPPIYVPYSSDEKLNPLTEEALSPYGARVHYRYVGGSDTAYWKLVNDLWNKGEDFIVVEQDIVVRPDVIPSFDSCHFPFCVANYRYNNRHSYLYGGNATPGWIGGF